MLPTSQFVPQQGTLKLCGLVKQYVILPESPRPKLRIGYLDEVVLFLRRKTEQKKIPKRSDRVQVSDDYRHVWTTGLSCVSPADKLRYERNVIYTHTYIHNTSVQRITRQRQFSIQGGSHNQNARREPRAFNSLSALSRKSAAFARINLFNLLSPAFLSNPGRAGHHSNKTRAHRTKTDGCCWFLHRLLVPLRPSLCTTRIAVVFDAFRLVTHPASLRYFSLRAHRRAGTCFCFWFKARLQQGVLLVCVSPSKR